MIFWYDFYNKTFLDDVSLKRDGINNLTDFSDEHNDSFENKTSTVGDILPHTITKIIDEDGNIVNRNVVGEICSKSNGLMGGYYNKPNYHQRRREHFSQRNRRFFIGTHPTVLEVQVVAAKDEKFGEEICAWIKLKDDFRDKISKKNIITFCKHKIAHYKIPRYIKFVDSFPMTVIGKPQKNKIREITNQILADKSEEL